MCLQLHFCGSLSVLSRLKTFPFRVPLTSGQSQESRARSSLWRKRWGAGGHPACFTSLPFCRGHIAGVFAVIWITLCADTVDEDSRLLQRRASGPGTQLMAPAPAWQAQSPEFDCILIPTALPSKFFVEFMF